MKRTLNFGELDQLTEKVIGAAIEVHRNLGPGLLESTYELCLAYELAQLGFEVERQKALPLVYKEIEIDQSYRLDLLVNSTIIIEVKSVETLTIIHEA